MAAESLQADIDSIYRSATDLLLEEGEYEGDGYYYFSSRPDHGVTRLKVTDYDSFFRIGFPKTNTASARIQLLEAGQAFINIDLIGDTPTTQTFLIPAFIKPETTYHVIMGHMGVDLNSTANTMLAGNGTINDVGAVSLLRTIGF